MRLGIVISVVLVAFLAFLFYVLTGSAPDSPTSATAPEKLKEIKLKDGLPALYSAGASEGSSASLYEEMLTTISKNKRYEDENVPDQLVESVLSKLIAASEAGNPPDGFLDAKLPMSPSATPSFGPALETTNQLALRHAMKLATSEPSRAVRILRANFALGQRAFELNHRLYPRRIGLEIMMGSTIQLNDLSEVDSGLGPALNAWIPELKKVQSVWDPKIQIIQNIRPQMGDLINIAANEKDVSFRSEAVLQLGVKKFSPGKKGNKDAIDELLKKLKDDEEPLIAKAAKAAEEVTRDDIAKMR